MKLVIDFFRYFVMSEEVSSRIEDSIFGVHSFTDVVSPLEI